MKIIEELRNDIIDSNTPLSSALRKAKVLASILKDKSFKAWVDSELNGYNDESDLPEYRVLRSQNIGTYSGPFGSGMQNVAVPIWNMSENFQKSWGSSRMTMGIKELESLINGSGTTLIRKWPAEAIVLWNTMHEDKVDYNLIGAHSELSKSSVEAIIDTTRNRLLDFILELREVNPEIMFSEKAITDLPIEKVHNIFNYSIYGGTNVVASGQEIIQNVNQKVQENDLDSLANYFHNIGIELEDIKALKKAIQDDKPDKNDFGGKVKAWIGNMIVKAAKGSWKTVIENAPKLITNALSSYYGFK